METKFKVGDIVVDSYGDRYAINKVRFDVAGRPIYTGNPEAGGDYMLFRDTEISLDN